MKRSFIKLLLLPVFIFIFILPAKATHIVGGDITVTSQGGGYFEITLTLFFDCLNGSPAAFDPMVYVGVFDKATNVLQQTDSLPFTDSLTLQLGDICYTPNLCVRRQRYIETYYIPNNANGYYLSWIRCCRNSIISNVANPNTSGNVFYTEIPDPTLQNSSPTFSAFPDAYMCATYTNTDNFSATDIDGDLLVYSLSVPLDCNANGICGMKTAPGPYGTIPWQAPYSSTNIMGAASMGINPQTGILTTVNPPTLGVFVFCVRVEEFRNGNKIGEIRRDVQYAVLPCATPVVNIAGPSQLCPGQSTTLTVSGGNTYAWSTGATTTSIVVSPMATTTYSVVANTSSSACAATSITVFVKSLTVSTSVVVNCYAPKSSATANVTNGGTPPYTYLWAPTNQTTATVTGLIAGGVHTVKVTDALGCSSTKTVAVTSAGALSIYVSGNSILCQGYTSTLTASLTPSGSCTYLWSTGSTSTTISVTPTVNTTYTVTGFTAFCSDIAPVTITVLPPAKAVVSPDITLCSGQSTVLTVSGGTNYLWNTGAFTSSIAVSPPSNSTYSVIVSIGPCTDTAYTSVSVLTSPTITVTSNTTICAGDVVTLSASGGTAYSWSNGSTSSSIMATPPTTTTYSVIAISGICSDTGNIKVTVSPPPITNILGNNNICQGDAGILTATGGVTYSWNSGETSAVIHPTTAGTYSVVAWIGSCTDTAFTNITVNQLPTASVSPDVTIVQGQSTELSASGGINYMWSDGNPGSSNTVAPQFSEEYCVTVFDANNCKDTACLKVHVISCETAGELYLPDAFSPNGDGENDELQIYFGLFDCIQSFHLVIYNRWGQKVYETSDAFFKWKGIYNTGTLKDSRVADTEVFVYRLDATLGDKSKISRKGNISLIR
jgi:gliding motility-associated-like protein